MGFLCASSSKHVGRLSSMDGGPIGIVLVSVTTFQEGYRMDTTTFQAWRVALYATMTRRAATLMNLLDALLTLPHAKRAIELTLSLAFARRWTSFYDGVQEGHLNRRALRQVYGAYLPSPPGRRLVIVLDASSIFRPLSPTARDRMFVHAANLPAGAKPIGIGWQYSLLVVAPDTPSSWTYVLNCTRIRSGTTPATLGAIQVAAFCSTAPVSPLLLLDRYYGSATFLCDPRVQNCNKLARIQTHRVFYRQPPPPDAHRPGRRPTKGARFQPKDPTTHGEPTRTWSGTDARGRRVTVRAWTDLYFPNHMTHPVTLLECARHDGPDTKADPRVIWLLWDSPDDAPLAEIPDLYARRFSVEHGIRFDKQQLLWDEPRLRTGAFDRWTDLVMMAHNSLALARGFTAGVRLPWESETRPPTPQQVRQALVGIMPTLGTPAPPPQRRGKSPRRAVGAHPHPAKRYPIVRKSPFPPAPAPASAA